ncbi:MAG TPA: family 16 glycosylhydrolase [Rugosimonospora sp.]|nr:family 16 glycosylhydrolase [Rugosimonospora sp.]
MRRRTAIAVAVVACLATAATLGAIAAHRHAVRRPAGVARPVPAAAPGILSYHKPALASSSRDDKDCAGCAPSRAVDLDPATRWASVPDGGPAWLSVDLGAPSTVDRVVLQWGSDYASGYELQVSPDGHGWSTVFRQTRGTGLLESLPVRGSGRYVRLYATRSATGAGGYSLWEFQVYGTGGAPLPPPARPRAPEQPLVLVWSDEFNGSAGSPPDPAKWRPDVGNGAHDELEYYTDNRNAYQDGSGDLVLEARREATPGSTCARDPVSGSDTCQYTSARLNTYGRFSFTYGRAEARIKVSGTPGLWPAFWLLGEDLYTGAEPWPNCGEIDVMEHLGRAPDWVSATIHAPAYYAAGGITARDRSAADFAAAFHLYAVDWTPQDMTFSVDGRPFFTVRKDAVERTRGPWVYDHPFVLLLDNAVGGSFPGPPGPQTALPQRMLVDYVRVYQ